VQYLGGSKCVKKEIHFYWLLGCNNGYHCIINVVRHLVGDNPIVNYIFQKLGEMCIFIVVFAKLILD